MKVLYIIGQSCEGGATTAILNLMKELKERIDIVGAVYSNRGPASYQCEELGVKCFYTPLPFASYPVSSSFIDLLLYPIRCLRTLIQTIISLFFLLNLAKKLQPDLIHTNIGPIRVGFRIAKRLKIPHVWHIRERQQEFDIFPFPSESYYLKLLKDNINYSVAITKSIAEYHQLSPTHSMVVYDGVVNNIRPIINWSPENYILFVGAVRPSKGIDSLIRVFCQIADRVENLSLFIAGRGEKPFVEQLMNQIKESGLEDRIVFLGQRSDIPELMSKSKGVVVPSIFEGFGFVTTEAMYYGSIVIGRNTGGTKEQFDSGHSIWGIEIGIRYENESELAQAIIEVCKKPKRDYEEMITVAQETVIKLYSKQTHAENMMHIYNKILNNV